jgi:hypothetical protein
MREPQARLLKKDIFGEVRLVSDDAGSHIVRDIRGAPGWSRWLARRLLDNEARALAAADGIGGVPLLLRHGHDRLERSHIEGRPLHEARPTDIRYFREAHRLLRRLHRAGIVHNDLAKEPNLLVSPQGAPAFIDFQLAACRLQRGALFRLLAREDLRHLLKHKRSYCPTCLTRREQGILDAPSIPARLWRATGKRLYLIVTRQLLGWADREGAGDRGRRVGR